MREKIKVGVAGCGKIARVGHVPGIQDTERGEVVALCDTDTARAEEMKRDLAPEADVFGSLDEMLEADIDAVCVCTPNNLHYPMTMSAFGAGLDVLCEKPIAGTLPEASRMIDAAKEAGKVLHINHSLRYSPLHVTIADLVQRGEIGDLIHLRCIRAGSSTPNKGWSPGADWFVSSEEQGGLILDIAVHMVDLLSWYGGEIEAVSASLDTRSKGIDVEDNAGALFQFSNGASGVLELSWTMPVGANLLELYGTAGRIRTGFSQEPIELTRVQEDEGREQISYPPLREDVKDSYQTFVDAVSGEGTTATPGELGRDALAVCDAMKRSARDGKKTEIEV